MHGAHSGFFHSTHPEKYLGNAGNIVYRSSWELKFFRYCDRDSTVLKWASEEFHIPYLSPVDHRHHRYFPDVYMQVRTKDGMKHLVVEIKPKMQTQPPKLRRRTPKFLQEAKTFVVNKAKWEAATKYCTARGWQFVILTEDHLFHRTHDPIAHAR
jgi:hypothetical protein